MVTGAGTYKKPGRPSKAAKAGRRAAQAERTTGASGSIGRKAAAQNKARMLGKKKK